MRIFAVGAMVAMLAQPAMASELVYRHAKDAPDILQPFNGLPQWQVHARCSGMLSARADYDRSRKRKATRAEAGSAYFHAQALKRLAADRNTDPQTTQAAVATLESEARAVFEKQAAETPPGTGKSPADLRVSECAAFAVTLSPPADTPPIELAEFAGKDVVTCKTVTPTGSHFGERVCMRKADADRLRERSQDAITRQQTLGACTDAGSCLSPTGP